MARQRKSLRNGRQPVFVDAGYCVALLRHRDQYHVRAQRWHDYFERRTRRFLITEAVLWEWLDGCSHPALRARAAKGYQQFQGDERVTVVSFEPAEMQAAFRLYKSRPDKGWGLTDCLSFVVMQQRGLTDALTADHHFEQAGFHALLLGDPPP